MRRIIFRSLGILAIGVGLSAAACDKKAPEGAAEPVAVEGAQEAAPADEAHAQDEGHAHAAGEAGHDHAHADEAGGHDHAHAHVAGAGDKAHDCAGHAGGESDCPFHDEKAAGDEHAGCAHGAAAAAPAEGGAAGAKHFGAAFTDAEARQLSSVLASATPDAEPTVKITGTIHKVCQKKGCWMVVKDGDMQARVVMKDYGFTLPMDSEGKATTVEGTLKVKVFTEAQAKHLAEDGGEDPSKVEGERKEFLLTAAAVEIGS